MGGIILIHISRFIPRKWREFLMEIAIVTLIVVANVAIVLGVVAIAAYL
jgi:hypothetical protein